MMRARLAVRSHTGLVRSENQDAVVVDGWTAQGLVCRDTVLDLPAHRPWSVAVLDGMGGYSGGGLASLVGGTALAGALGELSRPPSGQQLTEVYQRASAAIAQVAEASPDLAGMGATAAAIVVQAGSCTISNVGDTRVYRWWRNRYLAQLSVDDRVSPASHAIIQSLGAHQRGALDVHEITVPLDDETMLLIASDGLSDVLSDDAIKAILLTESPRDPAETADLLLQSTLGGGAPDNTTIVLVEFDDTRGSGADPSPPAESDSSPE